MLIEEFLHKNQEILISLGYKITETSNGLNITVPANKPYIKNKEAIYADVLRIYGYDNVPIPDVMNLKLKIK